MREREREGEEERVLCFFFFFLTASNSSQPCETPETRRHMQTERAASTLLPLPQRVFDQTEPFMGNDWRMHPLLS